MPTRRCIECVLGTAAKEVTVVRIIVMTTSQKYMRCSPLARNAAAGKDEAR